MSDSILEKENSIEHFSFEEAMQELEVLVKKLEEGCLSLEDSINLFERGQKLKEHCENKLKNAQLRVEKIQATSSTGEVILTPFDASVC
jgi:exodeoxyribonuclease VII small subunit